MKYQTTIVKSFFTVFILTFISSGLSAGTLGLDGKKKDKEKKEELSADGPYVIYEPDGKVCVISVTAQGQIEVLRSSSARAKSRPSLNSRVLRFGSIPRNS